MVTDKERRTSFFFRRGDDRGVEGTTSSYLVEGGMSGICLSGDFPDPFLEH